MIFEQFLKDDVIQFSNDILQFKIIQPPEFILPKSQIKHTYYKLEYHY